MKTPVYTDAPAGRVAVKGLIKWLLGYVVQRERAFRLFGRANMERLNACSCLMRNLNYLLNDPSLDYPRLKRFVRHNETELLTLLPGEQSRFKNQRQRVLQIIEFSKT